MKPWAALRFEGCLERESAYEVHRHRTGSSRREMKASRSSVLICKDKGSRSSSQKHRRIAVKNLEMFRYGREARARIIQSLILFWSCLLVIGVMGIPIGHQRQGEPKKGWKSVHYKDLSFEIPEDFLMQQGRVPLLSFIAVFFWSSWSGPHPLVFASIQHQSGPNLLPEEGFTEVLQRFQLENAFTLTLPLIGDFDLDPATIQVSEYVALGAPVREVRVRSRENGASYRLYLLTHTLANDSTIRSYLAVVGCAEERLEDEHHVLRTMLTSMQLP